LDIINKAGERGILFVAAAGNSGANLDRRASYPASYGTSNEIAVAATDSGDALASWSNYGAGTVQLAAPGVSILSTVRGNAYAAYSGTSMATPHVSGAAALVLARPECDPSVNALKSAILNNVDPVGSLAGKVRTGGRLNVAKAVQNCAPVPGPDFSISLSPSSIRIGSGGGTAAYAVSIARSGGFPGDVAFSIGWQNPQPGITASFSPVAAPGNSSVLTVTVDPAVRAGTYPFTVTGTSGSLSRQSSGTLVKAKRK
ncbi:MAG TPA: S8 family serine peptidase, partial [Candidatus Deferrimicrobiaceae bacterium]